MKEKSKEHLVVKLLVILMVEQLHVKGLNNKFKEKLYNYDYSAIVLHVGTNDLVKDDAVTIAKNLDRLIQDVKPCSNTIAISGIIKREDGKVLEGKIDTTNKLIKELH